MIERLVIENFRSFDKLDIELGRLNCFIGPNACGKSNLIDALAFLQQCVTDGVGSAFDERGGYREVAHRGRRAARRRRLSRALSFSLTVALDPLQPPLPLRLNGRPAALAHAAWLRYRAVLGSSPRGPTVPAESLAGRWRDEAGRTGEAQVFDSSPKGLRFGGPWIRPEWADQVELFPPAVGDLLLVGASIVSLAPAALITALRTWSFYDIEPGSVRRAGSSLNTRRLERTGRNLPGMLRGLLTSRTEEARAVREAILERMRQAVPGFDDVGTKRDADGTVWLLIREKDVTGALGSSSVSDGTVRLLAYHLLETPADEDPHLVCIEEPDRNLHPHLLEHLRDLLRTLSERTQVIITTHNPALVDLLEPDEVFLMDKEAGRTRVMRAREVEHIDAFLEDFCLGELWAQGAIGGVPE